MNWRRGLLRLWATISIAWIVGACVWLDSYQEITDPMGAFPKKNRIAEARAAGYHDDEIATAVRKRALFDFSEKALLPPLAL